MNDPSIAKCRLCGAQVVLQTPENILVCLNGHPYEAPVEVPREEDGEARFDPDSVIAENIPALKIR